MSSRMSVLAVGLMTLASVGCERITAPTPPRSVQAPLNGPLNGCIDVKGSFNPAAPGFIVTYRNGVDPVATTAALETKYAFTAEHVYTALAGFAARLSITALAGVRCESVVASISYDGIATIASP